MEKPNDAWCSPFKLTVMIYVKRAYDEPSPRDGRRVLVDRLWPRGVTKERARLDEWAKDLAPSSELRKWFGHDPAKWEEFGVRYREELAARGDELKRLAIEARESDLTLVYAARDDRHNSAVLLKAEIERAG